MKDVMVDLETMGNGSDAAIISIGACFFDTVKGDVGKEFYSKVALESSLSAGMVMTASTALWWMEQSDAARAEFKDNAKAPTLPQALKAFAEFLHSSSVDDKHIRIWGNGATFDNVILRNSYLAIGDGGPWRYYNDMCYRTVKNLHRHVLPDVKEGSVAHNAVDDAIRQAEHLIKIAKFNKGLVF